MNDINKLIITTAFIFLFSVCHSQTADWIIKLTDSGYNEIINQSNKTPYTVQPISELFNLVSIKFAKQKTAEDISEIFAHYKIVNFYPNQDVTLRDRNPDDFLYDTQWNLDILELPRVWEHTTGGTTENGEEIVVAILDDGYQFDHEDIQENIWLNTNEIPNDDIDNDNNGCLLYTSPSPRDS